MPVMLQLCAQKAMTDSVPVKIYVICIGAGNIPAKFNYAHLSVNQSEAKHQPCLHRIALVGTNREGNWSSKKRYVAK